jgi:hypothetical protein
MSKKINFAVAYIVISLATIGWSSVSAEIGAGDSTATISWQVIPAAGTVSSSTDFVLRGTAGQTAAGRIAAEGISLKQGFWQSFGLSTCCLGAIRGNIDYDPGDQIDISDLIYLVDFMFNGGAAPVCFLEADLSSDFVVEINIADLVALVDFVFLNGAPPPACP